LIGGRRCGFGGCIVVVDCRFVAGCRPVEGYIGALGLKPYLRSRCRCVGIAVEGIWGVEGKLVAGAVVCVIEVGRLAVVVVVVV
jgi:hypothetical protein